MQTDCSKCGTVIEYEADDVIIDVKTVYVACYICEHWNLVEED